MFKYQIFHEHVNISGVVLIHHSSLSPVQPSVERFDAVCRTIPDDFVFDWIHLCNFALDICNLISLGPVTSSSPSCMRWVTRKVMSMKKQLTMKRSCKRGVCWKKVNTKLKKVASVSLLSVENHKSSSLQKTIEVRDKWVKAIVTMDSGAAGHVMPRGIFLTCSEW